MQNLTTITTDENLQINDLISEELAKQELLQKVFSGVKELTLSKYKMIEDPAAKEMLDECLEGLENSADIYEQSLNALTLYTILLSHVFNYAKLLEKFVPKHLHKVLIKKTK